MRFYVRPGAAKAELAPLIRHRGGQLCRLQEPGAVLLAQPGEVPAGAQGDFVCTRYITDCVRHNKRLPLERYRLKSEPASCSSAVGQRPLAGRIPFTEADDRAILLYVHSAKRGQAATTGTVLWKNMAQARVTAHSWQAMRDRYLKQLHSREKACLLAQSPRRRALEPAPADRADASQRRQAMEVSQQEDDTAEKSKAPSIFHMANQEFEGNEWESESTSPSGNHTELRTSEEPFISPKVQNTEVMPVEDSAVPQSQSLEEDQPAGASSELVMMAIEDMTCFMEEFGVDLATVTQAFLKTSGEVAAVAHCLKSGPRTDGCPPFWSRQDDEDLLKGEHHLRSKLIAKYGAESVNRRLAFRKS